MQSKLLSKYRQQSDRTPCSIKRVKHFDGLNSKQYSVKHEPASVRFYERKNSNYDRKGSVATTFNERRCSIATTTNIDLSNYKLHPTRAVKNNITYNYQESAQLIDKKDENLISFQPGLQQISFKLPMKVEGKIKPNEDFYLYGSKTDRLEYKSNDTPNQSEYEKLQDRNQMLKLKCMSLENKLQNLTAQDDSNDKKKIKLMVEQLESRVEYLVEENIRLQEIISENEEMFFEKQKARNQRKIQEDAYITLQRQKLYFTTEHTRQ